MTTLSSTLPLNNQLKFIASHPAHFFALGFGSGLMPIAPGTFGTLMAFSIVLDDSWI